MILQGLILIQLSGASVVSQALTLTESALRSLRWRSHATAATTTYHTCHHHRNHHQPHGDAYLVTPTPLSRRCRYHHLSMSASRFYKLFHVDQPFDVSNRFQTSYILPPVVLAAIRLVIFLYILTTLIYKLAADGDEGRDHLCYFTNLTYWGLAFYFLVAALHGFHYHRTGSAPLQRWPRILQLLHGVLYTTIINYPVLVTIVYWVLLAPTDSPLATTFSAWSNVCPPEIATAMPLAPD